MEIKTKFNVNDLVETKRTIHGQDSCVAYEIMETISSTCYSGTQIFYHVRPIIGIREAKRPYSENKHRWKVDVGHGKDKNDIGWIKYREDELIPISKEVQSIIEGEKNSE